MLLIERLVEKSEIVKTDLPKGILARVRYPIMRFGVRNANKRVYGKEVAEAVLKDSNVLEKLQTRTLFGDQEHPLDSNIKLSKDSTSHIISNIYLGTEGNKKLGENKLEENVLYADFDVLPTEAGKFINILLEAGCQVGVSTRADGELEECIDEASGDKFFKVIPNRYVFQSVDFTGDPSTSNARPVEIIKAVESHYENKDIDKNTAIALLEMANTEEAKLLENKIKEDKQHSGCKCKLGEKKCGKGCSENLELKSGDLVTVNEKNGIISHIFPATKKAVVQFDTEKKTVGIGECIKLMKESKPIVENYKIEELKNRLVEEYDTKQPADIQNLVKSGNKSKKHNDEQLAKEKSLQEDVAPLKIEIDKKVEEFLTDHWTEFFDEDDAVNSVMKKFQIKDTDAIKYVKAMEGSKGRIDSIYAMSEAKTKVILSSTWDKLPKSKKFIDKNGVCYLLNKDGSKKKVNVLEETKMNESILYVNPQVIKRGSKFEVSWVIRKSDKSLECFDRDFINEVEAYSFLKQLQRDRLKESLNEYDEDEKEEYRLHSYIKNLQWEDSGKGFDVYVKFVKNVKGKIDDEEILDIKVYDENGDVALTPELKQYVENYIENLPLDTIEENKYSAVTTKPKVGELLETIKSLENLVVDLTAEKNKIAENYGIDMIRATEHIEAFDKTAENYRLSCLISENKLVEERNRYLDGINQLNESKASEIKLINEKNNKVVELLKKEKLELIESFKIEKDKLNEKFNKDLIQQYVELKTSMMGLKISNNLKTLFENCKSKVEVDSLIRTSQDAVREGILHYNKPNELIIEKTVKVKPEIQKMQSLTETALKSMGI